jgi:fido (protein-threonine AMPylation protein)
MSSARVSRRSALHAQLAEEIASLHRRLGGLPSPLEAEDIWTPLWHLEAHNSTALEGNTLALHEVEELLTTGRASGQKELKDYLEVSGYAAAAKWAYGQALTPGEWGGEELLTLSELREIHRLVMTPVWDVAPHEMAGPEEGLGNWRRHNIRAFPGGMRPPDWTEVAALLADWVADVNRVRADRRPIAEALAARPAGFERIHPFLDGNGRTGRLVLNLVLARLGYPPAIIRSRERTRYLRALRSADGGNPGPLGELIARTVLDNLYRFVVPAVAGPTRLVPIAALGTAELSIRALREAAMRGRLRAVRDERGQWRSSRRWVDQYAANRQH